jgi:hypothetical protein
MYNLDFNIDYNDGFKTFTITSQPFYDAYNQCYKNILMVNVNPCGPLQRLIRRVKLPKLSPFINNNNQIDKCGLALQSLKGIYRGDRGCCYKEGSGCDLMTPNEMSDLITFLIGSGYQIETQITNMLNQSSVKMEYQPLVFTVTYYGANQPNITYMR